MKKMSGIAKLSFILIFCFFVAGCATVVPKGFLKPSDDHLERRQLQMRHYDTSDEENIMASVAGVIQDLGFTLDESETKLGLICASKNADATDGGQIAVAVLFDAFFGSNTASQCDKSQVLKASVVTKPSLEGDRIVVRVTFQRVVWNMMNQISRVETITETEIYQSFYDSLSKSIFLEAHKI